jgi:adenylate cyclase
MASEVERKYRVARAPDGLSDRSGAVIRQGYLAITQAVEVRLRSLDDERLLTVKRGHGEVREEVEIQLGDDQFQELWPLTEGLRISKTRFRVPLGEDGPVAEVDVFEGVLEGVVLAEVEFPSEEEADAFEPPAWFGREVTDDSRFANQELAQHRPDDE